MNFTLQDLSTVQGATAAALFAMTLVQALKAGAPGLFANITGATFAFLITALLYLLDVVLLVATTPFVTPTEMVNAIIAVVVSWVGCALLALGIHSIATGGAQTFVKDAKPDSAPKPEAPPPAG